MFSNQHPNIASLPIFEVFGQVEELKQATPGLQSGNDIRSLVKMSDRWSGFSHLLPRRTFISNMYFPSAKERPGMLQILRKKPLNQRNMLYGRMHKMLSCFGPARDSSLLLIMGLKTGLGKHS